MTQENKELLFKDICARLSYEVICADIHADEKFINKWNVFSFNGFSGNIVQVFLSNCEKSYGYKTTIERIKPYLFPLSSMTEEQYEEFIRISGWEGDIEDIRRGKFSYVGCIELVCISDTIEWFNKNHFDYRYLIPMDLAIDATGLNIY